MTTFEAHFYPGLGFVVLGTWFLYNILIKYYASKLKEPETYSTTFFHRWVNLPLDQILVLIPMFCVILASAFEGFKVSETKERLFMVKDLAFLVAIALSLVNFFVYDLIPRVEYWLFAHAFIVQGLVFYYHEGISHGEHAMGNHTAGAHTHMSATSASPSAPFHSFLAKTSFALAVCTLLEMSQQKSVLAALSRCYFIILVGFWYIFSSSAIFSPTLASLLSVEAPKGRTWDAADREMKIVTYYCGSCFLCMVYVTTLIAACWWRFRRSMVYVTI